VDLARRGKLRQLSRGRLPLALLPPWALGNRSLASPPPAPARAPVRAPAHDDSRIRRATCKAPGDTSVEWLRLPAPPQPPSALSPRGCPRQKRGRPERIVVGDVEPEPMLRDKNGIRDDCPAFPSLCESARDVRLLPTKCRFFFFLSFLFFFSGPS
jgi:hypothetical protein